jgi:hypothetical protein
LRRARALAPPASLCAGGNTRGDEKLSAWELQVRQKKYLEMFDLMKCYLSAALPVDKKLHCSSCSQECFANPLEVRVRDARPVSFGQSVSVEVGAVGESTERPGGEHEAVFVGLRKLVWNAASTTCVGWSPTGTRTNAAHHSMKTFFVWMAERLSILDDIIFHENAFLFSSETFVHKPLEDTHICVTCRIGPQDVSVMFVGMWAILWATFLVFVRCSVPPKLQQIDHCLDGSSCFPENLLGWIRASVCAQFSDSHHSSKLCRLSCCTFICYDDSHEHAPSSIVKS